MCPDCNGTGRRRAQVPVARSKPRDWRTPLRWRSTWRSCETCGGIGDVDAEIMVRKLRDRARRDAAREEYVRTHWLPPIADEELAWLVDELGYERVDERRIRGDINVWRFRSERTLIELAMEIVRDTHFGVSLAPVGEPCRASLNECLAAHDLPRVDLSLPLSPSRKIVVAKLELASAALYHLVPWEVGGNWG
jgi:hypothetical protein